MSALLAGVLAAVAGALLPLPVYRLSVPAEVAVRDTCEHCGFALPAWIRWPSRCTGCGQRLGPPAWTTAAVAGCCSALIAYFLGPSPVVVLFVALVVVGTGLGAVDLACRRLPRAIVLWSTGVAATFLFALAAFSGAWGAFGRALLGAAALGLLFELLYLLSGQGLGYGDVRLAVLLGLCLGYLGWREVVWGAILPWLVNGPVVLALLLLGRVGRKTRLPFGPAMLLGALLAIGIRSLVNLEL